ncbi:MAG: peptide chain release factor N(5)-glutamine methyltransferase [Pirellulaceae bacterium]
MSTEPWTVGRLLKWTTDYFKQRSFENPRLDAEVLLAHVRGCERIRLYTAFEEVADDEQREAFRELVRRRASGTPVAYLVGHREFFSLSFDVTPDVLIPRPETEHLVTELLDRAKELAPLFEPPLSIADVGTGSGAIAVATAKQLPTCQVTAVDLSEAALAVARGNVEKHEVADRVRFVHGDLLAKLPAEPTFHIVASNPPYVSEREFAELDVQVREHEPRMALVAGPQGTEIIARLINEAAERLHVGGWLLMELSPMIEAASRELILAHGDFHEPRVTKDLAGLARVIQAQRQAR